MQKIYLDISNKGVVHTIHAKQGDVGRKFGVVLTDSGLPYIPTSGSAFSVWYSGASGEGNYTDIGEKSAFSVNENEVTVEMIAQMLSNEGEGILSLVLNDNGGNQIGLWSIRYVCESVPGANSEEAKEYYSAFSESVKKLSDTDAILRSKLSVDGTNTMEDNLPMGGFRVTGVGAPQADGDAVNLGYAKKVGNPHNLLDNSDFRNPVNQRGDVQYSTQRGYSLDRWYIYGDGAVPDFTQDAGFWAFNPNGATGASLSQRFSKGVLKSEKTYTLAWKDIYGNIETRTDCVHFDNAYDFAVIPLDAWAGLVWAALYEGVYTAETLPEYQPKGYVAELFECQRYYRLLNANGIGNGYTTGNGGMSILLLPFSMRSGVQPTFVCDGTIYIRANGADYASTVNGFDTKSGYMELVFMAEGVPAKHAAAFYTDGTKAALSADF